MPHLGQMCQQTLHILALGIRRPLAKAAAGAVKTLEDLLGKAALMQRVQRPGAGPEVLHVSGQQGDRQHQVVRFAAVLQGTQQVHHQTEVFAFLRQQSHRLLLKVINIQRAVGQRPHFDHLAVDMLPLRIVIGQRLGGLLGRQRCQQ
ncbi:hypothetical protein D3C79_336480 [compost metagenome]